MPVDAQSAQSSGISTFLVLVRGVRVGSETVDVGDITGARGLEMYLPLWVRLYGTFQTAMFNVKVIR